MFNIEFCVAGTSIVRARFDFKGLQTDELSFKEGDLLEVVGNMYSQNSIILICWFSVLEFLRRVMVSVCSDKVWCSGRDFYLSASK